MSAPLCCNPLDLTGLSRPNSEGLRGLRIGGLWTAACESVISRPRTPPRPVMWADSESARTIAQNAPLGSSGEQI
eukprot:12252179-Alexandrium_andersonii.AAC.1